MNNPLSGTDPSGYRSICGKDGLRSCDAIIYPNGMSGSIGGAETNNGREIKQTAAVQKTINIKIEEIESKLQDNMQIEIDRPSFNSSWENSPSTSGGTDSIATALDNEMSAIYEHEERMNELDDMIETSERRINEAGDIAAERNDREKVERRQREIDIERRQAAMRQEDADPVPQHNFDNIDDAHRTIILDYVAPLSSPALIAAGPATISAVGTAVKNKKKIIRGCVLITSLCNNLDNAAKNKKPGTTDINRRGQIEEIYRQGDALRRLNEHLKNVPTKVK